MCVWVCVCVGGRVSKQTVSGWVGGRAARVGCCRRGEGGIRAYLGDDGLAFAVKALRDHSHAFPTGEEMKARHHVTGGNNAGQDRADRRRARVVLAVLGAAGQRVGAALLGASVELGERRLEASRRARSRQKRNGRYSYHRS